MIKKGGFVKYFYLLKSTTFAESIEGPAELDFGSIEARDDDKARIKLRDMLDRMFEPDKKMVVQTFHAIKHEVVPL